MLDWIPMRGWLLIAIAAASFAPARYVARHLMNSPRQRDITQPPDDYSWRDPALFTRSALFLIGLAGLAIFIFTPTAVRFAQSPRFWPIVSTGFGLFAISTAIRGFQTGQIEPLVRGISHRFDRVSKPRRYWASLCWNTIFGLLFIWVGHADIERRGSNPVLYRCYLSDDERSARKAIPACSERISESNGDDAHYRAGLYAARGSAYHRLDDYRAALADYQNAVRLDPKDYVSHYNRGLIYQDLADVWNAKPEYTATLRIKPDFDEARERLREVDRILESQNQSVTDDETAR